MDRFLFDRRRRLQHFAGAFAVIMRAAGIPARLVGGYLGGEANPGTDYLIIRQADAHAWVEVWLPDQGWRRVDPTATVAPARVEQGLAAALPADDPVPLMARGDAGGTLGQFRLVWDRVDVFWNDWVLAYGPALQRDARERLGLGGRHRHRLRPGGGPGHHRRGARPVGHGG
ncbi:MAG: transglutaminase family protein [Arhodomonas sp.]|nr:transglutaminase family protein [Arhodomonas sp.]